MLTLLFLDAAQHHQRLHWSRWRRKRQAEARRSHWHRRLSRVDHDVPL